MRYCNGLLRNESPTEELSSAEVRETVLGVGPFALDGRSAMHNEGRQAEGSTRRSPRSMRYAGLNVSIAGASFSVLTVTAQTVWNIRETSNGKAAIVRSIMQSCAVVAHRASRRARR